MRAFSCVGQLEGQNLWKEYFLNVWGWHFSPASVSTSNLPCWLVEEDFVVAEECAPCSDFQAVSICLLSLFSHISSVQKSDSALALSFR